MTLIIPPSGRFDGFDRNHRSGLPKTIRGAHFGGWCLLTAFLVGSTWPSPGGEGRADTDFAQAIGQIEAEAQAAVRAGAVSGVSIAWVDDQREVYAHGFGWANKQQRIPATANTLYRAGSISKLFTAVAAMQLSEQGQLDIDQPVARYVPAFAEVIDPFPSSAPVTLRHLMSHRSGLIRESPVGSYFDSSEPSAAETVASLAGCVLVHPPGAMTKYSNSGVTVVGQAVAKAAGVPFAVYQREHLLGPMKMDSSDFLPPRALRRRLACGYLQVACPDGAFREMPAPVFEFGILPAGNLYTTVSDLGRFLRCLFAQGRSEDAVVLQAGTLEQMWTPQFTTNATGFGLGFYIGEFGGHKTVQHSGAVYGFTSMFTGLPELKLGAVTLCNDDLVMGPARRLHQRSLELLLQVKTGRAPTLPTPAHPLSPSSLAAFSGDYESESFWATIEAAQGVLLANIGGQRLTLRPVGPAQFEGSGRITHQTPILFKTNDAGTVIGFTALSRTFKRVDPETVPPVPEHWGNLVGSYGPDFIPVIISIKHGHLYAMTENEYDNRLTPVTQTLFRMPPGLYTDEFLVFERDQQGRIHGLTLANMYQRRHP